MEMESHSVVSQLIEISNLLAWGSAVLTAIVAFASLVRFAGIRNLFYQLLPTNSGIPESVFSYEDDDTWSSYTSSSDAEDDGDEISVDEDDIETSSSSSSMVADEEWKWTNRLCLGLSEIGGGRDVVVRSWEQQQQDDVEEVAIIERRKKIGLGWDNPIVSAWGEGGNLVRKRHIGNTYSVDLGSLSSTMVDDIGGSIEDAVIEWCLNAASYLPLLSPNNRCQGQ